MTRGLKTILMVVLRQILWEGSVSPDLVADWMGLPRFRTSQVSLWLGGQICLHSTAACMGHELRGHTLLYPSACPFPLYCENTCLTEL